MLRSAFPWTCLGLAAVFPAVSCSSSVQEGSCAPGDTRTCTGPGACVGGQACDDGGHWSPCDCGTASSSSSSRTSSSSSGATGCNTDSECPGQACLNGACVDTCIDLRKDGNETDLDCGGDTCVRCDLNFNCKVGSDCKSTVCGPNNTCVASSCTDQTKDQDETGIDCGGACAQAEPFKRCPAGQGCNVASDCESFLCSTLSYTCDPADTVSALDMISDMEDPSTLQILAIGGRQGDWYNYNDNSTGASMSGPTPTAIPGNRGTSHYAMHQAGSGFSSWGAGVGFDLNNTGTSGATKRLYDASQYRGLKFWVRGDIEMQLRVQFVDQDTHEMPIPPATSTICNSVTDAGTSSGSCDDHFGKFVKVTKEWVLYQLSFSELSQQGYGQQFSAFVPSTMVGVQFQAAKNQGFDFWIDDVSFFK